MRDRNFRFCHTIGLPLMEGVGTRKRTIVAASASLFVLVLAIGVPMPGDAATSKPQRGASATQCKKVAKGHSKVTAADIAVCKTSTVMSGGHCPSGSHVLIVRVENTDFALSRGHKPFDMGSQPGMGTYNQVCAGAAGKPPPPAVQVAFVGDLGAINTAEEGALAYLTAAQANVARGRASYTQTQILATVAPVTKATTIALRDLTALIPRVPNNMTTAAQTLSSALSDALQLYLVTAVSNRPEEGLPNGTEINAADVRVLTSELRVDVTDEKGLITGAQRNYVLGLKKDYSEVIK